MDIGELLTRDGIVLRSGASSKRQALHVAAEAAAHVLGRDDTAIFNALMERHRELWEAAKAGRDRVVLSRGPLDRIFSGCIRAFSKIYPLFQVIDSSPYDRSMRRIHNYMKEAPAFRDSREGYREIHFPPMSAWMVFTDGISHSVLTGQHALVTTVIVPLENARNPELAPFNVLARSAA